MLQRRQLNESLRLRGDAATVAVVIRFVDRMRDITDGVLLGDYSAQWAPSWMLPRHVRACVCPKRLRRSQFRI